MVAVKYDDLSMAFDFINSAATLDHNAYVSLDTGQVYWTSDCNDALDEKIPDDLETSDRYLPITHKNELDLGRNLALQFVAQKLLGVTNRSKDSSEGKGHTLASSTCWSAKTFSNSGIRLKPTLSKER